MKIKDIVNEDDSQATVTNYQPGKSVELSMPDGTKITQDLEKNPTAISNDEQGNPVFNLNAIQQGQPGQPVPPTSGQPVPPTSDQPVPPTSGQPVPPTSGQPVPPTSGQPMKPITTGSHIEVSSDPAKPIGQQTMGVSENMAEDDLIGSGKDGDIGGDATDSLLGSKRGHGIMDGDFEKKARGLKSAVGSAKSNGRKHLPESDELYRWLTIARLR